ncbi:MAG: DUF2807 domain-containing protein [Prevotellaceae bacterium]|nr:DUF2807 domain-containing protein [Prevotellaceae bacterium]
MVKRLKIMKKTMILATALTVSLAAAAETKGVTPFEEVSVNVPARVRFVQGDTYALDIQAADSLATAGVRWNIEDGVLRISSVTPAEQQSESLCITVVSPEEPTLKVGRQMEVKPTSRVKTSKADGEK